jgi:hypothetical protein
MMVNPLRQRMDMTSMARRAFNVEPLPAGAMPVYDVNAEAHYLDGEGRQVLSTSGNRLMVPMFEIASNPQISLDLVRQHRFEVIDRVQEEAIQAMSETEGTGFFSIVERATLNNTINAELTPDNLVELFSSVERYDLRVARLFTSPRGYTDMRRHIRGDHIEGETQGELLRTGLMGTVFGAQIYVSRVIPTGMIYAIAEPQFVGVLPIQTDVTVLNADNPEQRTLGFSIFEQIGMACFNPRGVAVMNTSGRTAEPVEPPQMEEPVIMVPRLDRYALLRALANDGL